MQMTAQRWDYTSHYLREVFGAEDPQLQNLRIQAEAEGMPSIAVSADVGHMLRLLTSMTGGMRALELGTLAGYSAVWIARGLKPQGKLLTVDINPAYSGFASRQFDLCGVGEQTEVRTGPAIDVLEELVSEWEPESVDVVFMDAIKREYPAYFERVRGLIAPGGLLIADNCLGSSDWWIDHETNPDRIGADALNRTVAADPAFEAFAAPLREGVLVARKS